MQHPSFYIVVINLIITTTMIFILIMVSIDSSPNSDREENSKMAHSKAEEYNISPAYSNGYGSYGNGSRPMSRICDVLNRCGQRVDDVTRKAEIYADNFWHHLRVSPSFTDAAMTRIAQGTKVLTGGGHEKVFQQTCGILHGEKLLKAYVCYLSMSSGPVIGTLYISTKRIAFCSDHPFSYYTPNGQQQWMYYKVVVQLDKLSTVNPSSSIINYSEKYIQIVTIDGHEFWFMGFISYDKALKQLTEALHRPREASAGGIPVTVA